MSTKQTVEKLGALSQKWLEKDFSFRQKAAKRLEGSSGFSKKMAEAMLDALFSELTPPKLWKLLRAELKNPAALDGFVRDGERRVRASGPGTILHVFSSNIPGAAVTSFVMGLLVGSNNIGKVSRRDGGILSIYLDSLRVHDAALAKHCRIVHARGEAARLSRMADFVVAYGDDPSLANIRKHLRAKTPFVGYGHRVSLSLVLSEALNKKGAAALAKRTAFDVWMADQRGCLSPVLVYAQKGGKVRAKDFAALIARELERFEKSETSRPRRSHEDHVAMHNLRNLLCVQALKGRQSAIWASQKDRWAVGYDEKLDLHYANGAQIVRVKGFHRLSELETHLQKLSGSLQAASLECGASHRQKIAEWLSLFGINRICRAGKMQRPPITWHHDGRLNLASWLTWTDLEK